MAKAQGRATGVLEGLQPSPGAVVRCAVCGESTLFGLPFCLRCGVNGNDADELQAQEELTAPIKVTVDSLEEFGAILQGRRKIAPVDALRVVAGMEVLRERWGEHIPLASLSTISFVPRDYQVSVARMVLSDMFGRAVLADEVGLGKTIEAGLILKELFHRKQIRSALVLVPSTLVDQWKEELEEKFGIRAGIHPQPRFWRKDVVVTSLTRAKMPQMARRLARRSFDIVVVDEAHALKNAATVAHQFVKSLRSPRLLLLTATPIENDLRELYNLLSILDPAAYPSFRRFAADFLLDRFQVKDVEGLRRFCARYLVRNRRSEVAPEMPTRSLKVVPYAPLPQELEFMTAVVELARTVFRRFRGARKTGAVEGRGTAMLLVTLLLKESCSSPAAVVNTLENAVYPHLKKEEEVLLQSILKAGRRLVRTGKSLAFLEQIQRIGESAVVYVEYMATHRQLEHQLRQAGQSVIPFTGALTPSERTRRLDRFRQEGGILLCTEVGGQGLNLQHCRVVINYDIPWNPMRLEQRIGRVHRFGQERPIEVVNFVAPGTYEEHVLQLLDRKLGLFSQVIGQVEAVMSFMEGDESLQQLMAQAICNAESTEEMAENFSELAQRIDRATQRYQQSIFATSSLFDRSEGGQ